MFFLMQGTRYLESFNFCFSHTVVQSNVWLEDTPEVERRVIHGKVDKKTQEHQHVFKFVSFMLHTCMLFQTVENTKHFANVLTPYATTKLLRQIFQHADQ